MPPRRVARHPRERRPTRYEERFGNLDVEYGGSDRALHAQTRAALDRLRYSRVRFR
jgi:hypothetical protein